MARSWLLAAALMAQAGAGQAQTIALTFDDGFDVASGGPQAVADNAAMLAVLKQHRLRGMLFPSGIALENADNLALVRAWSADGHAIGNHTYLHGALSQSDTAEYFADVERAQAILQTLPGWCPRLRFPYLDEGASAMQHDEAMRWLAQHDYGVASATIFMPDWELAQQYLQTLQTGSPTRAALFRRDYLRRIMAQAQAQNAYWTHKLKRSPAHVLLLHANHLNAAVLPDLLQALDEQGWTLVDPAIALQDPIYQRSYTSTSDTSGASLPLPVPTCY
ncbi:polysaccharide deacetylase family protein [Pusillimonas sp.]|uniref:polysaccharide deacetylase family protein n=1 Tax=Pusillimonas sp. TaxID=3040095 RepID=UPI0029AB1521|nr:polysaccharide deacetylase family protein [Pusillimonas sp.]MDX3895530.1 polysaccharide deacetylase family protein [Pusillimonas sp.]